MHQAQAGPSRPSPRDGTGAHLQESSDEIEEVQHCSRSRSSSFRPRKIPDRRLEEPEDDIIEGPAASRSRRIARKAATGSSIRASRLNSKTQGSDKGKQRVKRQDPEARILVEGSTDEDEDEDEPVFVGKSLARKYTFKSGSIVKSDTSSSSSIVVTDEVKPRAKLKPKGKPKLEDQKDPKPQPPPLPLVTPVENVRAPPVPAWLGKTSILLQIPYCVVCKVRWKKENGAARWRHISTCFPPLYRPPNSPPDLPQMVHEALIETSGASATSLLELHLNASPEAVDNRIDRKAPKPPPKLKGLAKMINVRPAEDRGEFWEGEIDARVSTMFGPLRTPEPSSPSARSSLMSPLSSPGAGFPSTQPLGDSILADHYSRDAPLTVDDDAPVSAEAELDEIPMPPSIQQRVLEDKENEEPADYAGGPFRSRGGLRAEGDLPAKRSAIWQDWDGKRYRSSAFSPIR